MVLRRRLPVVVPLLLWLHSAAAQDLPFEASPWRSIFQGVQLSELKAQKPRLMRGVAVRIELDSPDVSLLATPANGDRPDHTDSLKTSSFLTRYRCQLAINAAPFSPIHEQEGQPQKVLGLTISRGNLVSPEEAGYPSLIVTKDRRAIIAPSPPTLDEVDTAVSGFEIVLRDGEPIAQGTDIHPRTAAGISRDGKILYLLIIDGRQPGYSLGATTRDVALWLIHLGADDGINLDGGGSSTLVVEAGDAYSIVNRPIHKGRPGNERVVGSHLGIYAAPLDEDP
ncbi:MAG: hypothetical protein KatS3mg108_0619 [Isosphaeraceae bacterium]|jgi:hypothetical protein|nr:MAG: hypothetical protein KatS3mg108_0619 [Isosphaeraceae bacterium]